MPSVSSSVPPSDDAIMIARDRNKWRIAWQPTAECVSLVEDDDPVKLLATSVTSPLWRLSRASRLSRDTPAPVSSPVFGRFRTMQIIDRLRLTYNRHSVNRAANVIRHTAKRLDPNSRGAETIAGTKRKSKLRRVASIRWYKLAQNAFQKFFHSALRRLRFAPANTDTLLVFFRTQVMPCKASECEVIRLSPGA